MRTPYAVEGVFSSGNASRGSGIDCDRSKDREYDVVPRERGHWSSVVRFGLQGLSPLSRTWPVV